MGSIGGRHAPALLTTFSIMFSARHMGQRDIATLYAALKFKAAY